MLEGPFPLGAGELGEATGKGTVLRASRGGLTLVALEDASGLLAFAFAVEFVSEGGAGAPNSPSLRFFPLGEASTEVSSRKD